MFDLNETDDNWFRERNKQIKKYFSKYGIKQNFLIEIYRRIEREQMANIYKWFDLPNKNDYLVTMNFDSPAYEICNHIIGNHKSNIIFKSKNEIKDMESSDNYKRQLIDEVVNKLSFCSYTKNVFRKKQLFDGDNFIYYPIPYYIFVICLYISSIIIEKHFINNEIINNMLQSVFAILDLLENNIADKSYPICRGLIETFIKYKCMFGNNDAFDMRNKLIKEEINHNVCDNDYTQEFEKMFINRSNNNTNNKLDYLHYGFVDKIKNYHSIVTINPYSINGLFEYIENVVNWNIKEEMQLLKRYHKLCHAYVHDNCSNTFPLNSYFEVSQMLYIIVISIYKDICSQIRIDSLINELDVLKELNKAYSKLVQQIESRSSELFEEYYNKQ